MRARGRETERSVTSDLARIGRVGDVSDVLDALNARFEASIPYTMCAEICISINPYVWIEGLHDATVRNKYSDGSTEAHIYRVAEAAYAGAKTKDNIIVITGESGAGKTESAKLMLAYIQEREGGCGDASPILRTGILLEYMGNAQTLRNSNSSRFGKFLRLTRDGSRLCAQVTTYLLERSRVLGPSKGEGSFRIFYAALGNESVRNMYALHAMDAASMLGNPEAGVETSWPAFEEACREVGFDAELVEWVSRAVVVIAFIGVRDYANAAYLMRVDKADLTRVLTCRRTVVGEEVFWNECEDNRHRGKAMAMDLYSRLFSRVVECANNCVGSAQRGVGCSLGMLDIFGFEHFDLNGFDQLCINYCNECIQKLFVEDVVVMQQMEYASEGVKWKGVDVDQNDRVVELMDSVIFPVVDESLRVSSSAESIVAAIDARRPYGFEVPTLRQNGTQFKIRHYAKRVLYSSADFMHKNTDELRPEILEVLASSSYTSLYTNDSSRGAQRCWTLSVGAKFKQQMRELLEVMRSCELKYVRCVKSNSVGKARWFDRDTVAEQVSSSGILNACEVMRNGFPYKVPRETLLRTYALLHPRRVVGTLQTKGGFWGKTIAYLSEECVLALNAEEAAVRIQTWWKARRRRVAASKIQALYRGKAKKRLISRPEPASPSAERAAAIKIQRCVRAHHNTASRSYMRRDAASRQRERIRELEATVLLQEEWIFRARRMLQLRIGETSRILDAIESAPVKRSGESGDEARPPAPDGVPVEKIDARRLAQAASQATEKRVRSRWRVATRERDVFRQKAK